MIVCILCHSLPKMSDKCLCSHSCSGRQNSESYIFGRDFFSRKCTDLHKMGLVFYSSYHHFLQTPIIQFLISNCTTLLTYSSFPNLWALRLARQLLVWHHVSVLNPVLQKRHFVPFVSIESGYYECVMWNSCYMMWKTVAVMKYLRQESSITMHVGNKPHLGQYSVICNKDSVPNVV